MTHAQLVGLAFLLLFGFLYDRGVVWYQRNGDDKFTALPVIVGFLITAMVLLADSYDMTMTAQMFVALLLLHFAASGLGMTAGSWRRSL